MATRRKLFLSLSLIVGGVLASLLLAVAFFNLDRYRPRILSYVEANSGKTTEIDRLALTFFPKVTIHVYGMAVKNPPPFPPGDVVKVGEADAAVSPWALLHGAVVIKSVVLKDVAINLVSAPDGRWNFENPHTSSSKNTFPLGVIDSVAIERGQVSVSNLLRSGAVGPAFVDAREIAAHLTVVDVAAIVNPTAPSLNGQGTWQAGRLRVGAVEMTDVTSTVRLESWKVSIANTQAKAYRGTIVGDFSLNVSGKDASVSADARLSGVDVARMLSAVSPAGSIVTGTLDGDLKLAGEIAHTTSPLARLQGTGHVRVTRGQVPVLLSNPDIKQLAAFNDLGPGKDNPCAFASMSADLRLANQWISSKAIDIDGYGVDVDGAGRMRASGSGQLDYRGVVTITTAQGFWTNLFGRFGGATMKNGKLTFPFRVEGTIARPTISKTTTD